MQRFEFDAIIADIEKHIEGDGYFLWFHMNNGDRFEGGWKWLNETRKAYEIVVLDDNRNPPAYLPLSSIESIRLSSR